jgi:hypothetical protein
VAELESALRCATPNSRRRFSLHECGDALHPAGGGADRQFGPAGIPAARCSCSMAMRSANFPAGWRGTLNRSGDGSAVT